MNRYLPIVAISALLISACDYDNGTGKALERTEKIETFADPQIKAYEKAKDVQNVVDEAAQKRQQSLAQ